MLYSVYRNGYIKHSDRISANKGACANVVADVVVSVAAAVAADAVVVSVAAVVAVAAAVVVVAVAAVVKNINFRATAGET